MRWGLLPIGVLVIGAFSLGARQQDPQAAPEARTAHLQAHIESVESIRAVKRLQYAYGHYAELGLWNDFADLFADDASTNYQQGARGKEEVRKLFLQQVGQGKLGLAEGRIYPHILFQPVVHLSPSGRTAKGRWRILAMLGGLGGSATWYSGVYENEYVLDNGAWKIGVLRSEPRVTASYSAAGWRDAGLTVPLHYDAASIAKLIPDVAGNARTSGTATSFAALAARVDGLAQRAALLNAQGEVTNLQDAYGYAIDRKQWDQAAGMFSVDGTLELGQQGVYVGQASIRRSLSRQGAQGLRDGERNDHVYLQTLVSVAPDGRTAQARGVELIFSAAPGGANGELSEGTFENTFVKQDDAWRIQSVHFYPRMIVDAATGWARSAKPAPGPSSEFPPDRPPTSSYAIYPKFAVAPFHFDNPVTGRPPQYPEGVQAARPTATAVPTNGAAIRNRAELEARLAEIERDTAIAEAYDAVENLIGGFGYGRDGAVLSDGGTSFVSQIVQPVIEIARDGRSAKVRARLLELQGTSGGAGGWAAGTYEGSAAQQDGSWTLQALDLDRTWSGSYPGGWARLP
ncbi:MAG: nuclear transport factor 2 family protein [Acidobacteriota bacterium]